MTNNNTFEIITAKRTYTFKYGGAIIVDGIVEMAHGIRTKEEFLKALGATDNEAYNGIVDFKKDLKNRANNVFFYKATIFID